MFAFGCWAGKKKFLHEKGAHQNDMKTVSLEPFVLLNGKVENALFCLMDRYRNVCVWFVARNCRFPKVETHGCQRGNHRLPLQATAGYQRLELMLPNLGTIGYGLPLQRTSVS